MEKGGCDPTRTDIIKDECRQAGQAEKDHQRVWTSPVANCRCGECAQTHRRAHAHGKMTTPLNFTSKTISIYPLSLAHILRTQTSVHHCFQEISLLNPDRIVSFPCMQLLYIVMHKMASVEALSICKIAHFSSETEKC